MLIYAEKCGNDQMLFMPLSLEDQTWSNSLWFVLLIMIIKEKLIYMHLLAQGSDKPKSFF